MKVPYGGGEEQVSIPDDRFLGVLAAALADAGDEQELLQAALSAPLSAGPLHAFAAAGERVLVLVNDATRPTPTAGMLKTIWDDINAWDLGFLIATGTHRSPSEEECRGIFGSLWEEVRGRVSVHDARNEGSLVLVGTTSGGTEVYINRLAAEAGKILVLSSVEPHYFAGYTGGRKIFLPGVSGYKTIEQNHYHALSVGARALAIGGNPVSRDMDEALKSLDGKDIFSLMAVMDRERRVCHAAAGDLGLAFSSCAKKVDELYAVEVSEQADIVLAVATPPLDIDFYQAQKVVENGKLALREGGILIVVSACSAGVGNDAFLKVMEEAQSPEAVIEKARNDYRLGYHKAARLAEVETWAEIWAVTGIDDRIVRSAFMRPFPGIQGAVEAALNARPSGKMWVLMDAGVTVPDYVGDSIKSEAREVK